MKKYVKDCEEQGVEFRIGEFKLWVHNDPSWSHQGKNFKQQVELALKKLDTFAMNPKSQKSKSSRMSDIYIDEEQQMILDLLSGYETDEEKYKLLISTECILKPDLKARLEMVSSICELLTHVKSKRSSESIGLKDCILGSILGTCVKKTDLEKIGNLRVRSEKINTLREIRRKILTDELETFVNPELYKSSRGLPDSIKDIIEAFLLDNDVSKDDPSGRRMHINGKMKPIRILQTCSPENTKDLFDSSDFAKEVEIHPEGIPISKNRIEEIRRDMRHVKYFSQTSSGVDVKLTKAQLNYNVLRTVVKCNHPQHLHLFPVDYKEFLRQRLCLEKLNRDEKGELIYTNEIHRCEDEKCDKCTFIGYLSSQAWRTRVEDEEAQSSRFRAIVEDINPLGDEASTFHTLMLDLSSTLTELGELLEHLEDLENKLEHQNYDFTLPAAIESQFSCISKVANSALETDLKKSKTFKNLRRSFHLEMRDAEELEDLVQSEQICEKYYEYTDGIKTIEDSNALISANLNYLIKNSIEHRFMLQGNFEVEESMEEKFEAIKGHIGSLRFSLGCIMQNVNKIKNITSKLMITFPIEERNAQDKGGHDAEAKIVGNVQKKKKKAVQVTSITFKDQIRDMDPTFDFVEEEMVQYHYFDKKTTPGVKGKPFSYPIRVRRKVPFGQFLVLAERDFSDAKTHFIRGQYQSFCRSQQIRKGLIPPGFGFLLADFSTNVEVANSKFITDEQWRKTPQWSLENMIAEINVNDLKDNNNGHISSKDTKGHVEKLVPVVDWEKIDGDEFLKIQILERDAELPSLKEKYPTEESIHNPTLILRRSGHLPKSVEYHLHFFSSDTKHDTHLHNLNKQDAMEWIKSKMKELLGIEEWTDECPTQYLNVERFKSVNDDVQMHNLIFGNLCHLSWPGWGKCKIDMTGANATRKVKKNAIVDLGTRVQNIGVTVPYLNENFEFPEATSHRSRLQSRKYFGRIKHKSISTRPPKSRFYPLQNKEQSDFTKGNQCFYAHPKVTGGMFARRSSCVSCWYCTKENPEPLKCINSYAGKWRFGRFKRKGEVTF